MASNTAFIHSSEIPTMNHKYFFSTLVFSLVLSITTLIHAEEKASEPTEGIHYERIEPAQATSAPEGKVEVAEFFWYGCPHCYRFEPYVKGWLKNKNENVVFVRIPAVLNPKWEAHARFYYAAETLGVVDELHEPLLIAIHERKQRLYKEADLIDFAESRGIDREKFTQAYRSFSVDVKIQKVRKLVEASNITGVPAATVNGKFLINGSQAGSYEGMVYLMHHLSEEELALATEKK